ncbi:hypothetical protein OIU74_004493 [Salix koriyanagi]|uniref:Uncharacterized protein n=1 Tax=Salix koriyanagi TaxID=2511006 RepID=A0A9Q0ZME1_9ROSI|nr:hypothetical protein OIU74_004493 [Salix koriyanagi]
MVMRLFTKTIVFPKVDSWKDRPRPGYYPIDSSLSVLSRDIVLWVQGEPKLHPSSYGYLFLLTVPVYRELWAAWKLCRISLHQLKSKDQCQDAEYYICKKEKERLSVVPCVFPYHLHGAFLIQAY